MASYIRPKSGLTITIGKGVNHGIRFNIGIATIAAGTVDGCIVSLPLDRHLQRSKYGLRAAAVVTSLGQGDLG
jgi:hypothetical protein